MGKVTLNQFVSEETKRVSAFYRWYYEMNLINGDEIFPLEFDEDNAGLWVEALAAYSVNDKVEKYDIK